MSKKILGSIGLAVMFSLSACLEGILGTDEEETTQSDTTIVGTWYGYTINVDGTTIGLQATCIIDGDGSGFYKGIYSSTQDEPDSGNFTWEAKDNILKSVFDDGSTYESNYTITNGVLSLSYTEEGKSITEIYVKYVGNRPTEMVGKWIQVRKTTDSVYDPTLMTAVLSSDGGGISYEIENASDTSVNVFNFSWSISGDYMIILPSNGNLAEVNSLAISGYTVSVTRLNSSGETVVATLIKDISEKDAALAGNWTLTSAVLNGMSLSYSGTSAFNNDGTGTITVSGVTLSFSWYTSSGWLFVYTPALPQVSLSRAYEISGNTLTLTFTYAATAGSENVLVLTFSRA